MCLIIDTCTFHSVFGEHTEHYEKYAPIRGWLAGRGKIVVGGSKFDEELKRGGMLGILGEYQRKNRLVRMDTAEVDQAAVLVKGLVTKADFNDEHLVALVRISKCRVVCSDDKAASRYLWSKALYPRRFKRPKIYRTARNADLCCHEHIVDACR